LAAQDFAFTASLCYAKITPAALHRGDFDHRYCENAEAAGRMPKSELSDFVRVIACPAAPIVRASWMARS
jgi:hypothetical protein